jgi:hypothetical protein
VCWGDVPKISGLVQSAELKAGDSRSIQELVHVGRPQRPVPRSSHNQSLSSHNQSLSSHNQSLNEARFSKFRSRWVAEEAAGALWNLSMMDPLKDKIAAAGVLKVLVSLLTRWSKDADVVQVRLTRCWVDLTWFVVWSGQLGWKSVRNLAPCSCADVHILR